MFTTKKAQLFDVPVIKGTNAFVNSAIASRKAETKSGNNALKCSSTGDPFVDQFNMLGFYRSPRSFTHVSEDMNILWGINPHLAVCFILFMRLISRVVHFWEGEKTSVVQKGAGLKHESIMRMMWLQIYHPEVFWNNLKLFIACGSIKDIFEMLRYDLEYNGWDGKVLNWPGLADIILAGLENPRTTHLVRKYLPQLKARSHCTSLRLQANTMIAKFLCNRLKVTYFDYRKLKSLGQAHLWQQLISKQLFESIDFNSIHGRALSQLVSSKFIANHGLEAVYEEWIKSRPIAKFTGYVHELAMKITAGLKPYQKDTINKQYLGLVELAKTKAISGLLVVRDISESMSHMIRGQKFSSGHVAKAMAIFFSDMLEGPFKDAYATFSGETTMHYFKGKTFVDKWLSEGNVHYVGNTSFMSVARLFTKAKANGIKEGDFPTGILCISDGEFDPAELDKTNVASFKEELRAAGFSEFYLDRFQIILWNIPNAFYLTDAKPAFETFGDVKNVFYFSGYDASILGFLLGKEASVPQTAKELMMAAMDQEVMKLVKI